MFAGCRGAVPFLAAGLVIGAVTVPGTSATTLWWGLPAAVCAFLAGRQSGRDRRTAAALAAVLVAAALAMLLVPAWPGWASRFVGLLLVAAMLPWFAGRFLRQYRELVEAGWERAARLEREQWLVAEQARLRERTRIAQDMHDLLGHDLSLIALSAGALKLAPGLADEHRAAAQDIRARAGAAVDRLGEVIGVLREPPHPGADLAAGPEAGAGPGGGSGLDDLGGLDGLVERAASAGLDVRLRVEGATAAREVPRPVERAVHRVVQEALTNVAKHAPRHRATVGVRHTEGRTEVAVTDGPVRSAPAPRGAADAYVVFRTPAPSSPGGHRSGLIGLDERVRLAGGTFSAGPEDGGFAVRAALPHRPGPAPAARREGAGVLPPEHHSARRRLGRTAVAAVLVPLCTTLLLIGGVRVWDTATARESVLTPHHYGLLRLGQSRADVAAFLPERETTRRPADPGPAAPDAECEFYVQTADPFDDRSGDIYRICFRAGRLVSTDEYTGKDVR
ncbi:sensor histidine kinase [Streptomyces sp. NPDC090112]|uniref:sensor histidine kinase n=1 Tax=Streptomyces sp. NPDC090112 TaxID=3365949 RepID=UPI003802E77A